MDFTESEATKGIIKDFDSSTREILVDIEHYKQLPAIYRAHDATKVLLQDVRTPGFDQEDKISFSAPLLSEDSSVGLEGIVVFEKDDYFMHIWENRMKIFQKITNTKHGISREYLLGSIDLCNGTNSKAQVVCDSESKEVDLEEAQQLMEVVDAVTINAIKGIRQGTFTVGKNAVKSVIV